MVVPIRIELWNWRAHECDPLLSAALLRTVVRALPAAQPRMHFAAQCWSNDPEEHLLIVLYAPTPLTAYDVGTLVMLAWQLRSTATHLLHRSTRVTVHAIAQEMPPIRRSGALLFQPLVMCPLPREQARRRASVEARVPPRRS